MKRNILIGLIIVILAGLILSACGPNDVVGFGTVTTKNVGETSTQDVKFTRGQVDEGKAFLPLAVNQTFTEGFRAEGYNFVITTEGVRLEKAK